MTLKEIKKRLFSRTPLFFRKLQKLLLAIAFVAGMGLAQIDQLPKWDWLDDLLRMGVFAGLFGSFLAQLTQDTPQKTGNYEMPPTQTHNNNQPNNMI